MSSKTLSIEELLNSGDLLLVQDGNHGGNYPKASEFVSQGVPLITGACLVSGKIDYAQAGFISKERASELRVGFARAGDVLLTHKGTMGKTAIVPPSPHSVTILNPQITLYRVNPTGKLDARYLKYYFDSEVFQKFLIQISSTSTISTLSIREQKKLCIPVPSIEEQKAIASNLGVLDDRITLLRETNATLEAIAQALFKSWFVDFDPVRAKMAGRAPEGMDEATAALFPDALEETELGLVPKGWSAQSLDEIASYLNGLALQKFPPTGVDDLPVIKIAQLRKGDTVGADKAARGIKPEYIIQNGDVLFSWSGSLEVDIWCGGEGALNQHLFKVTSQRYPKWFYYLWTKHHLEHFRQVAASKATTMGHIQRSHLSGAKAFVPSPDVLDSVDRLLSPILDRIIADALQASALSELRDTLLPRLISGQLQLPEVADAN